MSFRTVSAILRGRWLLDKSWAEAHLPILVSVLKGSGSLKEMFDGKAEGVAEDHEPVKVLSNTAGVVYQVNYWTKLDQLPQGSIAMINIIGPVTKYGDLCAWGSIDHVAMINRLSNSPNITGIILNIDSPGGEAAGTAMLADAIKQAGNKKPVIAMIDDGIAASAAMWIASAANEIYTTQKTDMVGSIGVYTTIADWYGYFEKEGLKVRDIYAPQSTDKNIDYREALKENDEPIKADLKIMAQEFIDTVKRNRYGKITGDGWATGKMFYSKEATRIGLIDGQKTFEQIVRRMDAIISQRDQSNSNNMAFEKTLAAAKAESFEVVEGGFLLEETHLNNIEESITSNETKIFNLTEANNKLTKEKEDDAQQLQAAQQTIGQRDATIAEKDAEIARLKAGPASTPKSTVKTGDDLNDGNATAEEDEITKQNRKIREARGLKNEF
jgi:protease-4